MSKPCMHPAPPHALRFSGPRGRLLVVYPTSTPGLWAFALPGLRPYQARPARRLSSRAMRALAARYARRFL